MAIFSLHPHLGERARELPGGLFYKGTNPTHGVLHPHDLITSQRPHLLIPLHWGLEFQHMNGGGGGGGQDTSIQPTAAGLG